MRKLNPTRSKFQEGGDLLSPCVCRGSAKCAGNGPMSRGFEATFMSKETSVNQVFSVEKPEVISRCSLALNKIYVISCHAGTFTSIASKLLFEHVAICLRLTSKDPVAYRFA